MGLSNMWSFHKDELGEFWIVSNGVAEFTVNYRDKAIELSGLLNSYELKLHALLN